MRTPSSVPHGTSETPRARGLGLYLAAETGVYEVEVEDVVEDDPDAPGTAFQCEKARIISRRYGVPAGSPRRVGSSPHFSHGQLLFEEGVVDRRKTMKPVARIVRQFIMIVEIF